MRSRLTLPLALAALGVVLLDAAAAEPIARPAETGEAYAARKRAETAYRALREQTPSVQSSLVDRPDLFVACLGEGDPLACRTLRDLALRRQQQLEQVLLGMGSAPTPTAPAAKPADELRLTKQD